MNPLKNIKRHARGKLLVCGVIGTLFLVGCASFSFESNLDPSGSAQYFKVAEVKSYTDEELMNLNYEELGTVEGLDCRIDANAGTPRTADAKEDARKQAAAKGANGIVYSKCVHFENTPACAQSVSCYGRMVYVQED